MNRWLFLILMAVVGITWNSTAFALGGEGAFYDFLQSHPEIRRDLERNPNLVNDPSYIEAHPQFTEFYKNHGEVRGELRENATDFMHREEWDMAHPAQHRRAEQESKTDANEEREGSSAGLATERGAYSHGACANNNSKACRDARDAFARHHSGQSPEEWNNQWYQGQRGRWEQQGSDWRWNGAEGDQWNQGRRGHWYQERDGWQFRSDQGDEYRSGPNGWQWSGGQQERDRDRE